ncbi:hypothetical protein BKH16_08805 [Actinomyces oris]|nr:hypothetical protein BKH16_08805 [Actinomyces oris]
MRLLTVLVGVPAVLIVMLLCFLTPSLNSGAKDLPLAVAGPPQVTTQITSALEAKSPGSFETTTYDQPDQARQAVKDRKAIGAFTVDAEGVTVITASGAGTPYSQLLKGIGTGLEATGQHVTYEDVAPMTREDPTGVTISSLALPLAFGGNVSAVLLMTLLKKSPRLRLVGSMLMSVTSGLAITALLQFGFHTIDGSFWMTAGALSLGIAAISLTLIGAKDLFGFAGLGVAGFLLLFVSNPLSGIATGPQWLPAPWGEIGQLMPIGAAGTAMRSAVFFNGAGTGQAVIVLTCWALAGLVMSALGARLTARRERTAVERKAAVA